jgi:hypothetical protein
MNFWKISLLLSLFALAACEDDPAGSASGAAGNGGLGGSAGAGGSGGGDAGSGGAGLTGGGGGQAGSTQSSCPAYVPKAGKATASYTTFEGKPRTLADLPEIGCRTLRKRDGSVVGFQASFGNFDPTISPVLETIQSQIARIQVVYTGPYSGDGALTGQAMYLIQEADGSSASSGSTSVTISDGGKALKVVGPDTEINLTCDATDDVAPTAGQPLVDAPGRIILENGDGAAVALDGLECDEDGGFEIGYPSVGFAPVCLPTGVRLSMYPGKVASSPGIYDIQDGSNVLVDLVTFGRVNVGGSDTFTLSAVKPAKGTVEVGGGTSLAFKASFSCPSP